VADGVLESAAEDRAEHGDPTGVAERQEAAQRHLPGQETRRNTTRRQGQLQDQNREKNASTSANIFIHRHCVAQQRQVQYGIAPSPLDGDEHDPGGAARASSSMVRPDPHESLISA
jgi:hypothetical protein